MIRLFQPHAGRLILIGLLAAGSALLAPTGPVRSAPPTGADGGILAEIFLAREIKGREAELRRELESISITRVRIQYHRMGHPPRNLAIGKNVPAPVAREVIRLANRYNDGIRFLLPQIRFFPDYVAIGSSAFDEASNIPIAPEDLARLQDPALSSEEFHALYRQLTGEDRWP